MFKLSRKQIRRMETGSNVTTREVNSGADIIGIRMLNPGHRGFGRSRFYALVMSMLSDTSRTL